MTYIGELGWSFRPTGTEKDLHQRMVRGTSIDEEVKTVTAVQIKTRIDGHERGEGCVFCPREVPDYDGNGHLSTVSSVT